MDETADNVNSRRLAGSLRPRWLVAGVGLGALAMVCLVASFGRRSEPEYQGRQLSDILGDLVRPPASGSYQLASNAVVALGAQALPVIVRGVAHTQPWHVRQYLQHQGKLPPNLRAALFRWLDPHRHEGFRVGSLRALEIVGTNAAPVAAELLSAFDRLEYPLASPLAQAMVRVGPAVVPHLKPHLTDADLQKRGLAAFVMYQLGPLGAEAAPELIAGLAGSDDLYRRLVAQTLGRMGSAVLPQVTPLLASTNVETRLVAVRALNYLLPHARTVTPEMMRLLDDLSPTVRLEAASTLVNWWQRPTARWRQQFRSLPADHPSRALYGPSLGAFEAGEARLLEVLREGLSAADPKQRLEAATRLVQLNRVNADVIATLEALATGLTIAPGEWAGLTNMLQLARQQGTNSSVSGEQEIPPRPGTAPAAQSPPSADPPPADKSP